MAFSRRKFMQWAASASTLALATPGQAEMISLLKDETPKGFRPALLPTQKEAWDWLVWMAKLGPKYTGNPAHTQFVDFLATNLESYGLDVIRDHYTLDRWDAKRWEITIHPKSGPSYKVPVTSYYPYSGETSAEGVTGELVYLGYSDSLSAGAPAPQPPPSATAASNAPAPAPAGPLPVEKQFKDLAGKVVFIECPVLPHPYKENYDVWGSNPPNMDFPTAFRRTPIGSELGDLAQFKRAGAVAVILGWTDISDENAKDQYAPFGRPPQGIPGLWVGRETGNKLRAVAGSGAKATVVLEAEKFPHTPTDSVIATLPGMSDEIIIVNTHTDGPNANEENGGIGIIALAKYFSQIPKSERKRTLLFVLRTGHFAGFAPSIREGGVTVRHPDLIKRAVAALTIEHMAAWDYSDDASMNYKNTGKYELGLAIAPFKPAADIMIEALKGSANTQVAVVNPVIPGRILGESGGWYRLGIPAIGYIPGPNYLLAGPQNCCIDKLSPERLHAEIEVFAKVVHKMDTMSAAELKGAQG